MRAVVATIKKSVVTGADAAVAKYLAASKGKSNAEARAIASAITGVEIYFDWDACRSREGFYRYQGGTQACVERAIAYAPYAEMLWMETKNAGYEQAHEFATGVRAAWPKQWLSYNLSPSFNWSTNMPADKIATFIEDIAQLGFVWVFITLAGLHSSALGIDTFAAAYAKEGMKAYVEQIQEPERKHNVEVLTHQKWSGAEYMDALLKMVTGGVSSTAAMVEILHCARLLIRLLVVLVGLRLEDESFREVQALDEAPTTSEVQADEATAKPVTEQFAEDNLNTSRAIEEFMSDVVGSTADASLPEPEVQSVNNEDESRAMTSDTADTPNKSIVSGLQRTLVQQNPQNEHEEHLPATSLFSSGSKKKESLRNVDDSPKRRRLETQPGTLEQNGSSLRRSQRRSVSGLQNGSPGSTRHTKSRKKKDAQRESSFEYSSDLTAQDVPQYDSNDCQSFIVKHADAGRRIVFITSGGTTVPLEKSNVRFIDNFSAGTRGATSAEYFLKQGYAVIFMHRQFSLQPFTRLYSHSKMSFLDYLQLDGEGKVAVDEEYQTKLRSTLESYGKVREEGTLYKLHFTTIDEYLYLLRETSLYLRKVCQSKIQSFDDVLELKLYKAPKVLKALIENKWAPRAFICSFKLETDPKLLLKKARAALKMYGHQLVVANILARRAVEVVLVTESEEHWLTLDDAQLGTVEIEEELVSRIVEQHSQWLEHPAEELHL
ncbi:hypothetical protein MRB53_039318 [Persea americana]|nr:hypothetical protein MRB53_039318 [Persea americana]